MATVGEQLLAPESGWKRIDDSDVKIKYGTGFPSSTSDSAYNKTFHQCQSATMSTDGEVTFAFTGTKFRIIGTTYKDYSNDVQVTVDGVVHGSMDCTNSGTTGLWQILMYEVTGLDNKDHVIKLKMINKTTFGYLVDAIDIDEDGVLLNPPASIGEQLLQPDIGWQRFDDTDSKILKEPTSTGAYSGQIVDASCYNGSTYQMMKGTIKIYAYTDKFRIIGFRSTTAMYNSTIKVTVDGVEKGTFINMGSSIIYQCLLFETDMTLENHEIIIENTGDGYLNFDCIDISNTGYLLSEAEYKQTNKFPVLIGDNTITSETNVAHYASTLVNGEKQLLVSSVLESIYVTDGAGGYTQVGWSMNKVNAELSTRDTKIQALEQAVDEIKASITKNTI